MKKISEILTLIEQIVIRKEITLEDFIKELSSIIYFYKRFYDFEFNYKDLSLINIIDSWDLIDDLNFIIYKHFGYIGYFIQQPIVSTEMTGETCYFTFNSTKDIMDRLNFIISDYLTDQLKPYLLTKIFHEISLYIKIFYPRFDPSDYLHVNSSFAWHYLHIQKPKDQLEYLISKHEGQQLILRNLYLVKTINYILNKDIFEPNKNYKVIPNKYKSICEQSIEDNFDNTEEILDLLFFTKRRLDYKLKQLG